MAETKFLLEKLAYLAGRADSVRDRRELDELLRESDVEIDVEIDAVKPAGVPS